MSDKLDDTDVIPEDGFPSEDRGELRLAVYTDKGRVIIAFEESVDWIAMPADRARALGKALIESADILTKVHN